MKKTVKEFADMPVRKSSLAGKSYPENPDELSKQLDGYLNGKSNGKGKSPFAIVAPHIDLNAGGETFGAAFSQIKDSKAETFVILAIGHTLAEDFFACIKKDFETPIGTSRVDAEFLKNLENDFGEPIYGNQFAHRSEHSAEFQVLFLQKLFGGESPPKKIVPILLSFPENIEELDHPVFNKERVDKFIAALSKGIERLGDKVCVIAGIDMSHIGRRFGQKEGAPEKRRLDVNAEDRLILDFVSQGKKREFMLFMKKVNSKNHICGFPALYALIDIIGKRNGEILDYGQNVEGKDESMVSFAAMRFD